jgi:hypothetical protein
MLQKAILLRLFVEVTVPQFGPERSVRVVDAPGRRQALVDRAGDPRPTHDVVHLPEHHVTGKRLPDQVRLVVADQILQADQTPAGGDPGGQIVLVASVGRLVYVPDGDIAGLRILPDQVGIAVTIDIGGTHEDHVGGRAGHDAVAGD